MPDQPTTDNPTPTHAYDNPQITPKNFLLAVMHDPTVGLSTRIEAARMALPFTCNQPAATRVSSVTIKVSPVSIDDLQKAAATIH
jgi:hypothetical protein